MVDPKEKSAVPEEVEHWSLTTLREKLIKIGAKMVRYGRYITLQMAEVAVPRHYALQHQQGRNSLGTGTYGAIMSPYIPVGRGSGLGHALESQFLVGVSSAKRTE